MGAPCGSTLYAIYWHSTALWPILFGIIIVVINVNWELMLPPYGFNLSVVFSFDIDWLFELDLVQLLLYFVAWLEFMQILAFIVPLLLSGTKFGNRVNSLFIDVQRKEEQEEQAKVSNCF